MLSKDKSPCHRPWNQTSPKIGQATACEKEWNSQMMDRGPKKKKLSELNEPGSCEFTENKAINTGLV